MPPKKRPGHEPAGDIDGPTLRHLATIGTKSGLVKILTTLQQGGWLASSMCKSGRKVKRRLDQAVRLHSDTSTPYGTVMQPMSLPCPDLPAWQFVHPMALIYHLSSISMAFADMLLSVYTQPEPLHVVFYCDEVCPGNPLRPEKSRTLQCLYWTFLEFPDWLLCRTAAWMCLGTIRSTVVEKLPGGLSQLVALVMKTFFSPSGESMESGFTVCHGQDRVILKAVFGGFLCDEKAHKQVIDCKGASGWKPCLSCRNVMTRLDRDAMLANGAVPVSHPLPNDFDRHTNESVHAVVDYLSQAKSSLPSRQYEEQCSLLGFNTNEHGVMLDRNMRRFHRPVDHCIRDWMHVLVNGGVANFEVFNIINAMGRVGIRLSQLREFIVKFTLPSKHGKVNANWLGQQRFSRKKKTLSSFAGVMLSLVPIINCFLEDVLQATGALPEHVRCFGLLTKMLSLFQLGPTGAASHAAVLKDVVLEHARLYSRLYPNSCTPKFHQLLHIDDNIAFLGKALSCFTTERKHCDIKRCALHVFRHIDNTSIKHVLNEQCEKIAHPSESLFVRSCLVKPKPTVSDELYQSRQALLRVGGVQTGDVVYLSSHVVGRVDGFWAHAGVATIIAQLSLYKASGPKLWDTSDPVTKFTDAEEIADVVAWSVMQGTTIRVLPPYIGLV